MPCVTLRLLRFFYRKARNVFHKAHEGNRIAHRSSYELFVEMRVIRVLSILMEKFLIPYSAQEQKTVHGLFNMLFLMNLSQNEVTLQTAQNS
jgi:hypothetical protein